MKKVLILFFTILILSGYLKSHDVKLSPTITKNLFTGDWISVNESLPDFDVLVRTHAGDESITQKAILKVDGWYYPSGLTQLPWVPTHWQTID